MKMDKGKPALSVACLCTRLINLNERFSHLIYWSACTRFVSIQLGLKAVVCGAKTRTYKQRALK